ncbi:uncharacterized protein LOC125633970 isoform X8 [Caretta caretta]|uniref:uncharacterized protein LOC125633970 isoform X8 n=1 Tax=Caretta caretta TaxID=8467 RepID=UPI0020952C91|nr:uncharacterized protein LOC125633970 isoform X9 [Caretta caretta]
MATSLQLYKKSTFPPLLNIYQPSHGRNQNDKTPKKMMKDDTGKKRNNKSSFSDEDKEDAMKQALLEQRHLENYKNLYRLRNAMYVRYRDLLNKKVQKQRIQIQMSDLNFKQTLEQQGRKKSSASPPGSVSCQLPAHHPSKHMKAQEESEQIFPKLLLSWLSELQKRPEEQSRTQEVRKPFKRTGKHFHHERHLIYLHHMYHLALLNMTSSKRLLEKNGQFAVAEKEHSVRDLMEYLFPGHHKQPGNSSTERGIEGSTFPILLDRKPHEQCHRGFSKTHLVFKEMKNNSKEKQHENKGAVEILEDQKYNNNAFAPQEMITVPLSYHGRCGSEKARCGMYFYLLFCPPSGQCCIAWRSCHTLLPHRLKVPCNTLRTELL